MKTAKKLTALLCALAMSFGLAACGGGGESGASVVETLTAAEEKLSNAQSVEYAATIDMAMVTTAADGTTEELAATADMDLSMIVEPLKMKGEITLNMAELGGSMGLGLYAVEENDIMNIYVGMMGYWMGYTVDMSELSDLMDADSTVQKDLYKENEATAKKVGEESIGDVTATKYTITISGASMEKFMTEQGVIESMELMGDMGTGMDIDWADFYSDMGNMTMNIWIDAEGNVIRYEFDMLDFANKMMVKAMEQSEAMYGEIEEDVSFTKLLMVLDVIGVDTVEDFEIPAEVIDSAYFY